LISLVQQHSTTSNFLWNGSQWVIEDFEVKECVWLHQKNVYIPLNFRKSILYDRVSMFAPKVFYIERKHNQADFFTRYHFHSNIELLLDFSPSYISSISSVETLFSWFTNLIPDLQIQFLNGLKEDD
jgi:hypothetical protein